MYLLFSIPQAALARLGFTLEYAVGGFQSFGRVLGPSIHKALNTTMVLITFPLGSI